MGRFLAASAAFHALVAVLAILLGSRASSTMPLPPVYRVDLVTAAEVAERATPPEPAPPEEVEEEAPPEPEEEPEALPEPDAPDPEPEPEPERDPEPEREEAEARPERAEQRGPSLPVTLEGEPFPFPWYLEQLVRKIERNWRPSSNTLSATIHFRIDARGRIHEVEVHESSGNFLFDRAARRAVEAAGPLPPLPDGYGGDWLGVYFVFDTRVRAS